MSVAGLVCFVRPVPAEVPGLVDADSARGGVFHPNLPNVENLDQTRRKNVADRVSTAVWVYGSTKHMVPGIGYVALPRKLSLVAFKCCRQLCALVESLCVFFTSSRSFTRRHPTHPASVLTLHPREIQALWPQNYDDGNAVRRSRLQ